MNELILNHIAGNTYSIRVGYTDTGVYICGGHAVLIDTGSEESPGFIDLLRARGLRPSAVINTHLHIDHIGCSALLQERYGCDIFASRDEIECEYDGSGCRVQENPDEGTLELPEGAFGIIPLRGHSAGHQGVVTPDGVCFAGDAVMAPKKLAFTKLPYHLRIDLALRSMEKIMTLDHPAFVLSHFGCFDAAGMRRAAELNIKKESRLLDAAEEILRDAGSRGIKTEKLAALFMDRIGINREKQDIYWVGDTAMARIWELARTGRASVREGRAFIR